MNRYLARIAAGSYKERYRNLSKFTVTLMGVTVAGTLKIMQVRA